MPTSSAVLAHLPSVSRIELPGGSIVTGAFVRNETILLNDKPADFTGITSTTSCARLVSCHLRKTFANSLGGGNTHRRSSRRSNELLAEDQGRVNVSCHKAACGTV